MSKQDLWFTLMITAPFIVLMWAIAIGVIFHEVGACS